MFEVITRWGDELLDVQHVTESCVIAGIDVIACGAPAGRIGLVEYTVTAIDRPVRSLPYTRGDDVRVLPYVAAALALQIGIVSLAMSRHVDEPVAHPRARSLRVVHSFANDAYVPPVVDAKDTSSTEHDAAGRGAAMAGTAGAAGAPTKHRQGHVAIADVAARPQVSRADALAEVRDAGVLGSASLITERYRAIVGTKDIASGFDGVNVNGSLTEGAGAAAGNFGLAAGGFGQSGGGPSLGMIGTGSYGINSTGSGDGHGWGGHPTASIGRAWTTSWQGGDYTYAPMPHHIVGVSRVPVIRVTTEGALAQALVRRYLKRHVAKLEYCFEKQMLADPDLADGTVVVDFAIAPDGDPDDVAARGLAIVDACVQEVVAAIEWPEAAGPTAVHAEIDYKRSTHTSYSTTVTR